MTTKRDQFREWLRDFIASLNDSDDAKDYLLTRGERDEIADSAARIWEGDISPSEADRLYDESPADPVSNEEVEGLVADAAKKVFDAAYIVRVLKLYRLDCLTDMEGADAGEFAEAESGFNAAQYIAERIGVWNSLKAAEAALAKSKEENQ